MVYGISIAKVGNLCKQGRLLRCRRGAQCAPGVFALKGGGEVPVLHGLECGLRGRLAGKRGPCPLLSITPRHGTVTGARDRKQILSTYCGKI